MWGHVDIISKISKVCSHKIISGKIVVFFWVAVFLKWRGGDCRHMGSADCPTIAANHPCTTNHKYKYTSTSENTNTNTKIQSA